MYRSTIAEPPCLRLEVLADARLRTGDWRARFGCAALGGVTLDGRTALVVGFGAVGRRLARVLRALGLLSSGDPRQQSAIAGGRTSVEGALW